MLSPGTCVHVKDGSISCGHRARRRTGVKFLTSPSALPHPDVIRHSTLAHVDDPPGLEPQTTQSLRGEGGGREIFPGHFSPALCGLIGSHEEIKTIWLQSFAWEGRPLEAETSHYGFSPPGVCGDQRAASFALRDSAGPGPSALEPGGPAAGGAQTRWPD